MARILDPKKTTQAPSEGPITYDQLIQLGATDYNTYCMGFFPETFRQRFPLFANRLWTGLEANEARLVNAQMFRGSSKTTTLRSFTSKRIAYGRSRTILFISNEARHSERSLAWIKRKVETGHPWAKAFGLSQGKPWNSTEMEIVHRGLGISIFIIGLGIKGGIRGINFDDYRPDLIIVDDAIDEEIAASPEQLDKYEDLILGSLVNSLSPDVDTPGAKLVMLQTPFGHADPTMKALKDPSFTNIVQGCWTKETENLPLEDQVSIWEERFPTASLQARKMADINRNKASLFAREMEVRIVSREQSDFKVEWLQYFVADDLKRNGLQVIIAIDPVPPPSERELKRGLRGKDYEAIVAVGYKDGKYFLLDYELNRGHNPEWTLSTLFTFIYKWRPRSIRVESIAYQRTLSWIIKQEMRKRNRYVPIEEIPNKRAKTDRVVDALQGIASHGVFYIQQGMGEFITQFISFPNCEHDDLIDAVATGLEGLTEVEIDDDDSWDAETGESNVLPIRRGAP